MSTDPVTDLYARVRHTLKALQCQFWQASNKYEPLRHQFLLSPNIAELDAPPEKCWSAFIEMNSDDAWEEWQVMSNPDCCGRYFGCPDGLDEFHVLAESLIFTIREFTTSLHHLDAVEGTLFLLHEFAFAGPTPFLWLVEETWNADTEDVGILEQLWKQVEDTDDGIPFPTNPMVNTLGHNVFRSASAAIDIILNPKAALLIGEWTGDYPVTLPPPPEGVLTAEHEKRTRVNRQKKENEALAALFQVGPNASKIAKLIGVKRTTMLGWKRFRAAYNRTQADAETRKKNYPREID